MEVTESSRGDRMNVSGSGPHRRRRRRRRNRRRVVRTTCRTRLRRVHRLAFARANGL